MIKLLEPLEPIDGDVLGTEVVLHLSKDGDGQVLLESEFGVVGSVLHGDRVERIESEV